MVSGFLPQSRGDLETLTSSSRAFILQPGHGDISNKTWAGAKLLHLLYDIYLNDFLSKLYLQ